MGLGKKLVVDLFVDDAVGASSVFVRRVGGERDDHEDDVLVENDEEEVEQLELPRLHSRSQDGPSVILGAGVAAFAREIEGQSRTPDGYDRGHDVQSNVVKTRPAGEDPEVHRGHHRPKSVDPGRVTRKERGNPREGARNECHEKYEFEGLHRNERTATAKQCRIEGLASWWCVRSDWRFSVDDETSSERAVKRSLHLSITRRYERRLNLRRVLVLFVFARRGHVVALPTWLEET